jgi:glucosamine-6-phosphate deaminase
MKIHLLRDEDELSVVAAEHAASHLRAVLGSGHDARILVATGASQLGFLGKLAALPGIEWSRVTVFHLDEYVGLPADHPAGFRRYVKERFTDLVHPRETVLIDGQADPAAECRRVGALLQAQPIDAAFVGIGENGHLAFNDPPADFETHEPYLVVSLDPACRRQQVAEGWFTELSEVPTQAISISIFQLLAARKIQCVVPGPRKAAAVHACLDGEISPLYPASILRTHPQVDMYLDRESAALLRGSASPV